VIPVIGKFNILGALFTSVVLPGAGTPVKKLFMEEVAVHQSAIIRELHNVMITTSRI